MGRTDPRLILKTALPPGASNEPIEPIEPIVEVVRTRPEQYRRPRPHLPRGKPHIVRRST